MKNVDNFLKITSIHLVPGDDMHAAINIEFENKAEVIREQERKSRNKLNNNIDDEKSKNKVQ